MLLADETLPIAPGCAARSERHATTAVKLLSKPASSMRKGGGVFGQLDFVSKLLDDPSTLLDWLRSEDLLLPYSCALRTQDDTLLIIKKSCCCSYACNTELNLYHDTQGRQFGRAAAGLQRAAGCPERAGQGAQRGPAAALPKQSAQPGRDAALAGQHGRAAQPGHAGGCAQLC